MVLGLLPGKQKQNKTTVKTKRRQHNGILLYLCDVKEEVTFDSKSARCWCEVVDLLYLPTLMVTGEKGPQQQQQKVLLSAMWKGHIKPYLHKGWSNLAITKHREMSVFVR